MKLYDYVINMLLLLFVASSLTTCSSTRLTPKYKDVDPGLEPYTLNYIKLAKDHKITFYNKVTMGFNDLPYPIIGRCYYGIGFREVDIDKNFWKNASEITRMALIDHELTHCYCERSHDFAKDKEYEDPNKAWKIGKPTEGFFPDGCPLSLMYPQITDDGCTMFHYQEYMDEMFQRCAPF